MSCLFVNKSIELNEQVNYLIGNETLQWKNELVPKTYEFLRDEKIYYDEEQDKIILPQEQKFLKGKF